jgi:FlaA1/EpsC-like NDP-sugar epimerase
MILLFYQPFWLPWELAILALISFLGFRTISRKSFRSFGVTWISLISYPLSAILQLSIIESPISQRWFIVISGLIWLGILYAVAYYFTNSREFVGKQFLEITQAIHLITLWQILNVLNFTLIFVHLPWWQIWTVVVIAVSLLTYQLTTIGKIICNSIEDSEPYQSRNHDKPPLRNGTFYN